MKNIKEKMMPVALTIILLLSAMAIVPQSLAEPVDGFVYPDGIVTKTTGLTCGEEVTYRVTDNTLNESHDYTLWIDGPAGYRELETEESTRDGDIAIVFNTPTWKNLDGDPLGTWTLYLHDESNITAGAAYEVDIDIDNYYTVRVKYDGDWRDNLIYNTTYTPIYLHVFNWTGSKLVLLDDVDFSIGIYQPDGTTVLASQDPITTGIWDLDIVSDDLDFKNGEGNLEYYLPVWVDDTAHNTSQAIPVLLDVTATYPENAEWGDTLTVSGYVKDGQTDGIGSYPVALYAPVDGSYVQAATTSTYSTGRYSMSIETGYDIYPDSFSAGTWYIGTTTPYADAARVNESDQFEHPIDLGEEFIRYYWFEVASDDTADVNIESPDEIIDGFEQDINVTAEWNGEPFDIYADDEDSADGPAAVHITGIKAWDPDAMEEIDEDDYYFVGYTTLNADEDESYCEFNLLFNETGTGTFLVTWPYMGDVYFDDEYNNTDYAPNITGSVNFAVGGADAMNMVVSDMPDEVMIDESCGWLNESGVQVVTLDIYGGDEEELMNATIHVEGCGLDFTIDEEDEVGDHDNLIDKDDGMYEILINPKMGGVITITATNETDEESVSKDFSVRGLTGTVTTSLGDDLEVSVLTPETITVSVANGEYADVQVGYWAEDWSEHDCELYDLQGDGETEGEGLNGIFEFEIEDEDIEEGVGYLVVVAKAASRWMYEVIEIAPLHDLTIEIVEPINWSNKDFTVGFNHEDWELKVYGPDGDVMDDIEEVTAVLTDEDNDEDHPLQTINFKERSGSVWVPDDDLIPWFPGELVITAKNNTGVDEHDGNFTFGVDYATITYAPDGVTAGLDLEDFEVTLIALDANGDPLPEGQDLYLWIENNTGGLELADSDIACEEDGYAEFEINIVGDLKTWINITLDDNDWEDGNATMGDFMIDWPMMDVVPDTIFIGKSNTITITAMDYAGVPVEGINLTLWTGGTSFGVPDPVETNADGQIVFSIQPEASGKANVTIARGIEYVNGMLTWDINDSIITDTYITITSIREMKISVSKSPIFEGETLTVTVTSGTDALSGVDVEFAETTVQTDNNGQAVFTAPDPGVESAVYTITAEKVGFVTVERSITVIKIWDITVIAPSSPPGMGEEFTITVLAKGAPLAGGTVEFNGKTYTSGADGKLTITAPDKAGDYTVTASYEDYKPATFTITIKEGGGIPGFELLTLIAALGVAFILIRRRR